MILCEVFYERVRIRKPASVANGDNGCMAHHAASRLIQKDETCVGCVRSSDIRSDLGNYVGTIRFPFEHKSFGRLLHRQGRESSSAGGPIRRTAASD